MQCSGSTQYTPTRYSWYWEKIGDKGILSVYQYVFSSNIYWLHMVIFSQAKGYTCTRDEFYPYLVGERIDNRCDRNG